MKSPIFKLLQLAVYVFIGSLTLLAQQPQLPDLIPYRKGDKWGFCDRNKKIVIECRYDEARPFSCGLAAVKIGEKWGYINKNGKMVIPAKYLEAYEFEKNFAIVKAPASSQRDKDYYAIITPTNLAVSESSLEFEYIIKNFKQFIKNVDLNRIIILNNDLVGYINQQGDTIISPIFHTTKLSFDKAVFRNGYAVVKFNDKWCIIDTLGVITNEIPGPFSLKNGIIIHENNEKYNLINARTNKALASQSFDNYRIEDEKNYIEVARGEKWGVIDLTGKQIVPFKFSKYISARDNLFFVRKGKKSTCYNWNGQQILKLDKWEIIEVNDSSIAFKPKKGLWGVNDINGNVILPQNFDFIKLLSGNKIFAQEGLYLKLYNSNGKLIKTFIGQDLIGEDFKYFQTLNDFQIKDFSKEGVFVQSQKNGFGLLDKQSGEWIVTPCFEDVYVLNNYLAKATYSNFSRVILKNDGQTLFQEVKNIFYLDNNFKLVKVFDKSPLKTIPKYFVLNSLEEGGFLIEFQNYWLFIDKYGNQISKIEKSKNLPYMNLNIFANGLSEVSWEESSGLKKRGFIDYQGNQYWEEINLLEPQASEQPMLANVTPKLYVPIGHSAWMWNLDVSNDGRYAVSASWDGSAILWDLKLGKEIRKFKRGDDFVVSCDISNNGKVLLLGRSHGEIEMWNLLTGELITTKKQHTGTVNSIKFSNDDKMFVSCGDDGQIIIWDSSQGKKITDFQGGKDLNISSVCFIPNTTRIIAGFNDGTAKVLDYSNGRLVYNLRGHEGLVYDVAVSPDGSYFLTGCSDKKLRLWDRYGNILNVYSDFNDEVFRVTFSPDGKYFAAGGGGDHRARDFSIRIYSLSNKSLLKTLKGHDFTIVGLRFLPDSKRILSASWDMTLKLWNFENGLVLKNLKGLVGIPNNIVLKSSSNIIVASDDGTFKVIDLQDGKTTNAIMAHPDGCTDVFVSENSIFTCGSNGSVKEWDINTYKYKRSFNNINDNAQAVVANETYVISVNSEGKLVIWSRKSGEKIFSTLAHSEGCVSMAISHDGNWIATGGKTGIIKIWNGKYPASDPIELRGHKEIIRTLAFSPQDNYLVSGEGSINSTAAYQSLKLWKIPEGTLIKTINHHKSLIDAVAFIPSKKMLASGSIDTEVKIWDLETFSLIKSFDFEAAPTTINSTPNGEFIFIGLSDGTIRIIRTSDWTEVAKQISFTDGNWITITKDNYYTGSKGAVKNLTYEFETKIYSFDQFDMQYNRPDIVLERLGLASPELIQAYRKAYEKRLRKMGFDPANFEKEFRLNAPEIKLKSGENLFVETSEPNYTITFTAEDKLYNLDRYFVTVNGVPLFGLQGRKFATVSKTAEQTITAPLSTGNNTIKISALNQKGVESLAEQIEITYNPTTPVKPNLYVIAIGVSKFKQSAYDLTYADKDATDIINLFKQQSNKYGEVKTFLLQNQQATVENILALRNELEKTTPDDQIVMFFASHGLLDNELDYYLATHDVDFSQPQKRGLRYDKLEALLDGIPARKKLLLIDACHSGEIDKEESQLIAANQNMDRQVKSRGFKAVEKKGTTVDLKTSFELMKELFTDLRRNSGTVVISSAGGAEFAYETENLRNGVFTYCVIEGLQQGKADRNVDKKIYVSELTSYVGSRVKELTGGKQNPTNRAENVDTDFQIW